MKKTKSTSFLYFAYGSNMLTEWLRERCPSAELRGSAVAKGFSLSFAKKSNDGSGKATLILSKGENVFGVLFNIKENELPLLDYGEKGYDRKKSFQVFSIEENQTFSTITYLAKKENFDRKLIPYDWYKALAVAGAIQNRLPDSHIETIRRICANEDLKSERKIRKEALNILYLSGFLYLLNKN